MRCFGVTPGRLAPAFCYVLHASAPLPKLPRLLSRTQESLGAVPVFEMPKPGNGMTLELFDAEIARQEEACHTVHCHTHSSRRLSALTLQASQAKRVTTGSTKELNRGATDVFVRRC